MGAQAPILLKRDSPVLYIVGAQAPILSKRDYPVLYIVGAQAPILSKRGYPVLYIVGAQAPILLKRDSPILYIVGTHVFEKEKKICSCSFSGIICGVVVVAFSWRARILGECSTNLPPA